MENRQYFVKQVAQSIRDNHAKHDDSFIFGISGKWGEGKTRFLTDLETELKSNDTFEIFKINAWKFSSDNLAFLRNFLKVLRQKKTCWWDRLVDFVNNRDAFRLLNSDVTETTIHVGWLIASMLYIATGISFYAMLKTGYIPISIATKSFLLEWRWLWSIITVPALIALLGKMIIVQKGNHSISTIDRFDELLVDILNEIKKQNKKPVIFVDDLDRVTPEAARDVLDNLRTFFDKPDMTFLVTGDHTVLERYLGKDLLPDGGIPEQLEEGRRFLKKIFNVYWRLPLPIDKELDKFLDDKILENTAALDKIFSQSESKKIFQSYLRKYFEKNFRQIIRFLDTTLFTFQVVQQKSESTDESQKRYFKELTDNPLLVIRILMIQELCAPLFDKILNDYQILGDLEYAVEKKDAAKINAIIDPFKKDLSPFQESFIKKFLYEEPRFYRQSSLVVSDIQPFLFLAADASFGDQRGPSGDDFMAIVTSGDPVQVKNALISTGDKNAEAGAKKFVAQMPVGIAEATRAGYLKTLLITLSELPAEYSVHKIFAKELPSVDLTFMNNLPQPQKMDLFNTFWRWLDIVADPSLTASYENRFPFNNAGDLDQIKIDNTGPFTSLMTTRWLKGHYSQNVQDAINRMLAVFPKLKIVEVQKEMAEIGPALVAEFVRDQNAEWRNKRFNLIKDFTPQGKDALRTKFFEQVQGLNNELTQWSTTNAEVPWKKSDVEDIILKKLEEATDFNSLLQPLNFAVANGIGTPETIWPKLLPKQLNLLVENINQIIDKSYQTIAPSIQYATMLSDALVEKIKDLGENEQIQWLDYLRKSKWLWSKLDKKPSVKKLIAIPKSENEQLKEIYKQVQESWE